MTRKVFRITLGCDNCGHEWPLDLEAGFQVSSGVPGNKTKQTTVLDSECGELGLYNCECCYSVGCPVCELETYVTVEDREPLEKSIPEVVTLCGSTKFMDTYREENYRLTLEGKIVISVAKFGHAEDVDLDHETKAHLDELHKRKIDKSDRIHVINVDGYIGDSTSSEIEYAEKTGTEVTYLEERPEVKN